MQQKWRAIKKLLEAEGAAERYSNRVLRISLEDEALIAPSLQQLSMELGKSVDIGSYPVTHQVDGAAILVTIESKNLDVLSPAATRLRQLLPSNAVIGALLFSVSTLPSMSVVPSQLATPRCSCRGHSCSWQGYQCRSRHLWCVAH